MGITIFGLRYSRTGDPLQLGQDVRRASRSCPLKSYAILFRAVSVSWRVNARSVSVRTLPADPSE